MQNLIISEYNLYYSIMVEGVDSCTITRFIYMYYKEIPVIELIIICTRGLLFLSFASDIHKTNRFLTNEKTIFV